MYAIYKRALEIELHLLNVAAMALEFILARNDP